LVSIAPPGTAEWPNGWNAVPDSPFDEYLDLVEAARELGIHPQSLRRLIKQGRVPATLFAGKYLIERDKLDMFKSSYDPRPGRKPIRRLL
jgi:excisionase family DNA binding protein